MKSCGKCEEEKALDDFARASKASDGRQSWCRECQAEWRKANRDRQKAYQEKYLSDPEVKERAWRYRREYQQRPDVRPKRNAQSREYRRKRRTTHPHAIKLREIKSEPCVDCGKTYPPEIMELDHVRGERGFSLGVNEVTASSMTTERFEAELAKCELRCPTCHRLRHFYARRPELEVVPDVA